MKYLLLMMVSVQALPALAGWVSNGGDLIEHSRNPWFFSVGRSRQAVKYCILHDRDHFQLDESTIRSVVRSQLNFWWNNFSAAKKFPNEGLGEIHVATESFVEVDCSLTTPPGEDVPIKFQFGFLYPYQQEKFKTEIGRDVNRVVAIAVRERYNKKTLKGAGFIYVAADSGPLKLKGQNVMENPWSDEDHRRLALVLRHELGHIFGLGHFGASSELMGARFPEYAVSRTTDSFYLLGVRPVFMAPWGANIDRTCANNGTQPLWFRLFHLPQNMRCLALRFSSDRIEVSARRDWQDGGLPFKIGTIHFKDAVREEETQQVSLWLPKEQEVFADVPAELNGTLRVAAAMSWQYWGEFITRSGKEKRELLIQLSPRVLKIGGRLDGKMQLDVFRYPNH